MGDLLSRRSWHPSRHYRALSCLSSAVSFPCCSRSVTVRLLGSGEIRRFRRSRVSHADEPRAAICCHLSPDTTSDERESLGEQERALLLPGLIAHRSSVALFFPSSIEGFCRNDRLQSRERVTKQCWSPCAVICGDHESAWAVYMLAGGLNMCQFYASVSFCAF